MASRRTRIKGIANIPQRRKTTSTNNEEINLKPETEAEIAEYQKPNLKLDHENTDPAGAGEIAKNEKILHDTEKKCNNVQSTYIGAVKAAEAKLSDFESQTTDVTANPQTGSLNAVSASVEPKLMVPIGQNFIKPTASVNSVNRKLKEVDTKWFNNNVNVGRSIKIVILNEVISYPNQNQSVLIENHQPDHKFWNSATVPGVKGIQSNFPSDLYGEHLLGRPASNYFQTTVPDVEYPIPPPSPNKFNRSRIKAVPRLGQRNTSISASESEDESRRNYRIRNDSVCSSTSGLQDLNSMSDCLSPQKPREFNSVIQRKCKRTEQSRKLAEARRDFYLKFGNKTPDRQKLTMIDLIFYNPVTNPMNTDDGKGSRRNSEAQNDASKMQPEEEEDEEESVHDTPQTGVRTDTGSDEENELPAPQIKIGPQGELVLDEKSLLIENKTVKKNREKIEKSELVNGDFDTGYGIYKRAKRAKDWSKQETLKFYKALNTIGTDFTLMSELFPRRSRRELKMKFKKEERVNKTLIDKAIMQPCGFDFEDFKLEVEMEEKELQTLEEQKERDRILKQDAKKRKTAFPMKKGPALKLAKTEKSKKKKNMDIFDVLDEESDADESEVESIDDENSSSRLLQTIQKPTRSGRVPKKFIKYNSPGPVTPENSPSNKNEAEPGSLIVMGSMGPNGQPVYKVCMVTGNSTRQQIGDDLSSLEKALQCKENGITNLFTLTATPSGAIENVAAPEENNVTIPEENVTIPAGYVTVVSEERSVAIPEEHDGNVPAEEDKVVMEEGNVSIPAEENNFTIATKEVM